MPHNAYATLDEYKSFVTMRGSEMSLDTSDDTVIGQMLGGVSRYIERQCGRIFVPFVETRYYDVPSLDVVEDLRELKLDGDLLEVISLTNGDGSALSATDYTLQPINKSPYRSIHLKGGAAWIPDSDGESKSVIEVVGIWGFHSRYADAWLEGSTLAEALDASETGFDMTSGAAFKTGQIIRIDNELSHVESVATNTVNGTRGANGSTAAVHNSGTSVQIWHVQDDIRETCLQITQNVYALRSGQSSAGRITVNAAGIVIRPEEVPSMAQAVIQSYRRRT